MVLVEKVRDFQVWRLKKFQDIHNERYLVITVYSP